VQRIKAGRIGPDPVAVRAILGSRAHPQAWMEFSSGRVHACRSGEEELAEAGCQTGLINIRYRLQVDRSIVRRGLDTLPDPASSGT